VRVKAGGSTPRRTYQANGEEDAARNSDGRRACRLASKNLRFQVIANTLDAYANRFQKLKADLAQIEYFSKGTLLARMVWCGKPQCACGKDPSKRHGPYYEWTYKAGGKTVTVRLTPEAAPLFRAAARQYRKLKTILNRMEKLSRQALVKLAKDPSSRSPT
jgi:Family of unknown function (DUF6788)